MFRKDSTFLNVNMQLGAQYVLDIHQSDKLFLQRFQTIVNGINTGYILQYHRLPPEADVPSTWAWTMNSTTPLPPQSDGGK